MEPMARQGLTAGLLVAVILSGCGQADAPPSHAASTATEQTRSQSPAPPQSTSTAPNQSSSGVQFTLDLAGNFGDNTRATIVDWTWLVRSADAASTAVIPFEPHLLPAAANPEGAPRSLVVYWGQLSCRRETDITMDQLEGGGLLVTIAPRGTGDCDSIGSTFAVQLTFDGEIASTEVAVRQVREATGDIEWVARSPEEPGTTATVLDRALALAGASLIIPPRLLPGAAGIAKVQTQRVVSIAWAEPCGAESSLALDGSPDTPRLVIAFVAVEPCEGVKTREVMLEFVAEGGAASLSIEREPPQ
jgi:hypothetical protein